MKKILVTGCNGQLGRAIRAEYANEEVTFINTDVAEGDGVTALDIADVDAVLALVRAERPQVIINCAAHTNVDACETQWDAIRRIPLCLTGIHIRVRRTRMWMPVRHSGMRRIALTRSVHATWPSLLRKLTQS